LNIGFPLSAIISTTSRRVFWSWSGFSAVIGASSGASAGHRWTPRSRNPSCVMVVDAPRQSPSLPIADHDAFRGQLLPDLGT
jgi:hypothetical protein